MNSGPVVAAARGLARCIGAWLVLAAAAAAGSLPPGAVAYDPNLSEELTSGFVSGTSGTVIGPIAGTDINDLVGATTFYLNGFTGSRVAIANIEAGHVWSGHEALASTLQIPNHPQALNEIDRHATWVGMILAGRPSGASAGNYQQGMAPAAQLYSGAIASQWNGARYATSFNTFIAATIDQYRRAFTGMDAAGRRADVINSSFGGGDVTGTATRAMATDGLANANPRTTFVASAGNDGPGPNMVNSPASAYNNISVGALGSNPLYNTPTSFTSGGPNNYSDPVNGLVPNARQVVDIAAPGQQLSSAYYGGTTGGNGTTDNPAVSGTGPTGGASGIAGGPNYYSRGILGTSFAAPTVAGGAALLIDAGYALLPANPDARDTRVIKSVLMNAADKTVGWNNAQVPHPNFGGGVLTTQGLDNRVGTGALNLESAWTNYLGGTTDVAGLGSGNLGQVRPVGWDFGLVTSAATNDYYFDVPLLSGARFTATLTWFRDRIIDDANITFDASYDNLNLELWSVAGGSPVSLISESASLYNNSEHFSFVLSSGGMYALRVRCAGELFDLVGDADQALYGVAWAAVPVPEPSTVVLLAAGLSALGWAARRRATT